MLHPSMLASSSLKEISNSFHNAKIFPLRYIDLKNKTMNKAIRGRRTGLLPDLEMASSSPVL